MTHGNDDYKNASSFNYLRSGAELGISKTGGAVPAR